MDAALIGCALAIGASCGGRSDGGEDEPLPPEPIPAPAPGEEALPQDEAPADDAPTLPEGSGGASADSDDALPEDDAPLIPEGPSSADDEVLAVLDTYCGACHGPSGADANAGPGPLEFTDDVARMVALGIIVPYNGAFSPLVQVMEDGGMPPPGSSPRPSESDITLIRAFIDDPRLWPPLPPVD